MHLRHWIINCYSDFSTHFDLYARIYGMFGPKIKGMRLEQGLKQRQLAELLGTDMPMYSKMELGARRVRRDQVPKLAELYKVDEKELMTLWLADGVYAALKEEDENLRLDAIDLAKEYFMTQN